MSSFKEFQRSRQSTGTVEPEPYRCCACNRPFRNDGAPMWNSRFADTITCPYCSFHQSKRWATPGFFLKNTKRLSYKAVRP